jgi:exopolyphosphatase/guanosine-5'-triphosphate,3'-diphosphate pyrophosphatase
MGRDVSVQPLLAWLAPLAPFMPHTLVKLWPAAVMLSDIAQFEHDDHREYVAFTKILYAPLLSATHAERFFLAMAIFARYAGSLDDEWLVRYKPFLPEAWLTPALALGQALRLAKVLCAGCHDILPHCPLVVKNGHLDIAKTPQSPPLEGDVVDKRLKNLQKTLQSIR